MTTESPKPLFYTSHTLYLTTHPHRWRNPVRIVGAPMSMARAQSGRGSSTRWYLVEYAHFARSAARKFNGRPSLRVPPGSFDAKYHVYVYYYTGNRRLCMGVPPYRSVRYQNFVGALPPQVKYCGGACPPCPPRFRRL